MIIELCSGGDVFDKVLEKGCLTVEEGLLLFV
jgi:calcium-dependent protein kinase